MFNFYFLKDDIILIGQNFMTILYRILIVGGSLSGKINALLNLTNHDRILIKLFYMLIFKIAFYEAKCKLLINKRENTGLKYLNDSKAFIEYLNDTNDIYKNIEEYNPTKTRNIKCIWWYDCWYAWSSNSNWMFFRGRKLNICLVYISQSYFAVPKIIRLNSTYYFVIRILNNRKLQQIAIIVSTDINFQDFMNL